MFVCPVGLTLITFCANLLAKVDFQRSECTVLDGMKLYQEDNQGKKTGYSRIEHLSCCDIEKYHIFWYCSSYRSGSMDLGDYLRSSTRASYYSSHPKHFEDMASDLIKLASQISHPEIQSLRMGVSSNQLQRLAYDSEHQDYRTFLTDGSVACLQYDYNSIGYCLIPYAYYKSSRCDLFVHPCDAETQGKRLDLRKFIKQCDAVSENLVIEMPEYNANLLKDDANLLKKDQYQLKWGPVYEGTGFTTPCPTTTTRRTTTTKATTTSTTTSTTPAPTLRTTARLSIAPRRPPSDIEFQTGASKINFVTLSPLKADPILEIINSQKTGRAQTEEAPPGPGLGFDWDQI